MSETAVEIIAKHRAQLGLLLNGVLACNCHERFDNENDWATHVLVVLAAGGYIVVGPITMGPPPEPVLHCSCQGSRYDGDDGWDRDCPSHGVAVKDE